MTEDGTHARVPRRSLVIPRVRSSCCVLIPIYVGRWSLVHTEETPALSGYLCNITHQLVCNTSTSIPPNLNKHRDSLEREYNRERKRATATENRNAGLSY